MSNEIDYSTIAMIIGKAAEELDAVQDWLAPEDDEELANLIIRVSSMLDRVEEYVLERVK